MRGVNPRARLAHECKRTYSVHFLLRIPVDLYTLQSTLSSPGKKLVTRYWSHISTDLSTEKTPPDVTKCHKIKYRNVRRFWSLHATSSTYIQCEKKPGDVWNNLCAMVPKTRKRLPRASFSRYPSEALWPNIRLRNSPDSEIVECSLRS